MFVKETPGAPYNLTNLSEICREEEGTCDYTMLYDSIFILQKLINQQRSPFINHCENKYIYLVLAEEVWRLLVDQTSPLQTVYLWCPTLATQASVQTISTAIRLSCSQNGWKCRIASLTTCICAMIYWCLSARLGYPPCVNNGDTAVLY